MNEPQISKGPSEFHMLRETAKQRKLKERGNIRIHRWNPSGRTMPEGWAKALISQMKLLPVFETTAERNLWRRWRQGRVTTKQFKDAVKRMVRARGPAVEHPHDHEHDEHCNHDH